jgi:hypothetical protein
VAVSDGDHVSPCVVLAENDTEGVCEKEIVLEGVCERETVLLGDSDGAGSGDAACVLERVPACVPVLVGLATCEGEPVPAMLGDWDLDGVSDIDCDGDADAEGDAD